jgi:hypothetical protein
MSKKRNWAAIAGISDQRTRIAVSLVDDPEILAGFERGFPHLFVEGDDEGPLKVPLSALKAAVGDYSQKQYGSNPSEVNREFSLDLAFEVCSDLGIPIEFQWYRFENGPNEKETLTFLLGQLIGQKAEAGMLVTYRGKRCMVLTIGFDVIPVIGSVFTEPPTEVREIILVDAEFIALDK